MSTHKNRPFNIMFSEETYSKLRELADARETTIAHLLRTAALALIDHGAKNNPRCADGTICLCPQRWTRSERIQRLDHRTTQTDGTREETQP